jgi:hypothetical protein
MPESDNSTHFPAGFALQGMRGGRIIAVREILGFA